MQRTNCSGVDASTIRCVTPQLEEVGVTALDYSLILDGTTPTTSADLSIMVLPDPTNFRLGDTKVVLIGSPSVIEILVAIYVACTHLGTNTLFCVACTLLVERLAG